MTELALAPLKQLRLLRLERGLTQSAFARRVGISRTLIELLETGYAPRTRELVEAIAGALGWAPETLSAEQLEISINSASCA